MQMRSRFLCIGVASLALSAAPSCLAASGTLSVTGAANTAVDWQVTTSTDLDTWEPAIATKSRLFGLAIENLRTHAIDFVAYDGSAIYAECHWPNDVLPPCGKSSANSDHVYLTLEPGSYRMRLFGDGSGTVTMPITNRSITPALVTDQPAPPALVQVHDPRVVAPADVARDVNEFDFKQGSVGSYLVQQTARTSLVGPGAIQMCLRPITQNATCTIDAKWGWTSTQAAAAFGDGFVTYAVWGRGEGDYMPPGRYAAEMTLAVAGTSDIVEVLVVISPS
jgi:hypothetical protein